MNLLIWTEKYSKQAIQDEIALAAAHPKYCRRKVIKPRTFSVSTLLDFASYGGGSLVSPGLQRTTLGNDHVPQWRRSWNAIGPISTELGLEIRHDRDEGTVTVCASGERRGHTEQYKDHPGVDEAVVAALVRKATEIYTEAREAAY
jgi:hypothetical protein